jgi:alkaline phosphatase
LHEVLLFSPTPEDLFTRVNLAAGRTVYPGVVALVLAVLALVRTGLTTHPHEAFATDSAATSTTMSTGVKTTIGAIGVGPDGQSLRTVMEAAKARGSASGS